MPQNIFKKRGKRGAIKKGGRIGRLIVNLDMEGLKKTEEHGT